MFADGKGRQKGDMLKKRTCGYTFKNIGSGFGLFYPHIFGIDFSENWL